MLDGGAERIMVRVLQWIKFMIPLIKKIVSSLPYCLKYNGSKYVGGWRVSSPRLWLRILAMLVRYFKAKV